ncbi:TPA: hypothetical protein U1C44_001477 [Streptococcus suis]|nr:hypothetical protein [Streptococcus suis]HEM3626026.1 hypothetical protein [Streptococcus suis]HEM3630360.1 hypothetical protein [Streptococcus suis]HEM3635998.1 hypothetical protein [Streptococcus suis]HEM3643835.1 hypothetical protein [Streptococcus suis]
MTKIEEVRSYFRANPGKTLQDCVNATSLDYETVKQYVWRDHKRHMLTKDNYGGITYQDEFEIPDNTTADPAKRIGWDMLEILVDRAKDITDDEMLLKFSKEIRLYFAELK